MSLEVTHAKITPTSDVIEHPFFWHEFLRHSTCDTLELFEYGPYLARTVDVEDPIRNRRYYVNDLYWMLCVVAQLFRAMDRKQNTFYATKETILYTQKNMNNAPYEDIIREVCEILMEKVRGYQKKAHAIESSVVAMAPIVTYDDSVLRHFQYHDWNDVQKIVSDNTVTFETLKKILTDPYTLIQVMTNHNSFIKIDDMTGEDLLEKFSELTPSKIYFLLCFICKRQFMTNANIPLTKIIKINDEFNKILNGDQINITEVLADITCLI